jgi:hypothetical protein
MSMGNKILDRTPKIEDEGGMARCRPGSSTEHVDEFYAWNVDGGT